LSAMDEKRRWERFERLVERFESLSENIGELD
jgi:hypothetical protein